MSETPNSPGPENPTPPNEPKPAEPNAGGGPQMGDPADVEKNKAMALLAYIGILWLVPLLAAKDSPFAKYHANQGLILFLACFAVSIVVGVFAIVASFIPVLGWCADCICMPLPFVAYVVYAVIGILNSLNGKMKPLPGIPDTVKIIK